MRCTSRESLPDKLGGLYDKKCIRHMHIQILYSIALGYVSDIIKTIIVL